MSWATPVDVGNADGGFLSMTQRTLSDEGLRTGSRAVPEGSLVLSIRAPIGYVAQVAKRMAFNQGCRGLIAKSEAEPRYFRYQLSALGQELSSRGAGSTFMELSSDALGDVPIIDPPIDEQRRIADFLDSEIAQINEAHAARRTQAALLAEREQSFLDQAFARCQPLRTVPLKHLLIKRPRYGVLVPHFVEDGVRFIRVNDLLDIEARAHDLRKIPDELSASFSGTLVKEGDILISVVGTLGRSIVASQSIVGANIARAICSVRVDRGVEVELLHAWLGTSSFREQALIATSTDTAQPTLGMEDLSNFGVPWPSCSNARREMIERIEAERADWRLLSDQIDRQSKLLIERRQALITAAVTGQIDVTTARGVDV